MKNPTHNASIEEALTDLSVQEYPNVLATAQKYHLVESTLRRRWKDKTTSHPVCALEFKRRLTDAQEESLIFQINRLIDRGLSPTVRIVYNLAEEVINDSVRKN